MLKHRPALAEHAMCALKTLHKQNMLHEDIVKHCVVKHRANSAASGCCRCLSGTAAETDRKEQTLECLLNLHEHVMQ